MGKKQNLNINPIATGFQSVTRHTTNKESGKSDVQYEGKTYFLDACKGIKRDDYRSISRAIIFKVENGALSTIVML